MARIKKSARRSLTVQKNQLYRGRRNVVCRATSSLDKTGCQHFEESPKSSVQRNGKTVNYRGDVLPTEGFREKGRFRIKLPVKETMAVKDRNEKKEGV